MKNTIKTLAAIILTSSSTFGETTIEAKELPLKAARSEVRYEANYLDQEVTVTKIRLSEEPFKEQLTGTYLVTIGRYLQNGRQAGSVRIEEVDAKLVIPFKTAKDALNFYDTFTNTALGLPRVEQIDPNDTRVYPPMRQVYPLVMKGKPGKFRGAVVDGLGVKGYVILNDPKIVSVRHSTKVPNPLKKVGIKDTKKKSFAERQKEWEAEEGGPGRVD